MIERTNIDNLYKLEKDKLEKDKLIFTKVNIDEIKIMGKSIQEIITILNGLELEKITNIEMTMENILKYLSFYQDEQNKFLENNLKSLLNND